MTTVGLYNAAAAPRPFGLQRLHDLGVGARYEAIGAHRLEVGADGMPWPLCAAWWVVDAPG